MKKPKVDDIIELENQLKTEVYREIYNEFREDECFYELDFKNQLSLPKGVAEDGTVLPTARDLVDAAVDHTDIKNIRISVNKKGLFKISDEEHEMMRKFYTGIAYMTNVESPISPWRVAAKHYWTYGVSWLKTVWDADRWPDKPLRKNESEESYLEKLKKWEGETELSVPIIISAVNPLNVMPDPSRIDPQFVIESHEKAYYSVQRKFPRWKNPKGKGIKDKVRWIEYWDKEYRCYLADGEPVLPGKVIEHNYGFLPYVEIDSGLGNFDADGSFKARWVGVLRYIRELLVSESRDYSISDIILKTGAWPWWTVEGGILENVDQYYGAITTIPEGAKLEQRAGIVPPDALRVQMGLTADILASHAATRSNRGMGETGVRSGADRRLLIAEGGLKYAYSTEAFQFGTAHVLTNCARLFKNVIPGDMRLWAKTAGDEFDVKIDKNLMKEPFNCHVEFAPISEEDEYRRHDNLRMNLQTGLITKREARKQMTNLDPLELEKQELREVVKAAMVQPITQAAAARMGVAISQRQLGEAAKETPPNQLGQMTTQIPNRAQQGSPTAIAQQRNQQSGKINPMQGIGGGGSRHV